VRHNGPGHSKGSAGVFKGGGNKVNAEKQKEMAGWKEEQRQEGVVRVGMVRKVNSEQKKPGKRQDKFRPEKSNSPVH
jgi:hypothetical protein